LLAFVSSFELWISALGIKGMGADGATLQCVILSVQT
jgi:hypothetical protein